MVLEKLKEKNTTIALIGASNDKNKYGNKIYLDLRKKGYNITPINPKEKTIEKSENLFDFDSEYDFQFDPCVNIDNIRYLRAKTFLRLDQIDQMLSELNLITTYSCSELDTLSDIQQGIDCLNNLSSLLTSCH